MASSLQKRTKTWNEFRLGFKKNFIEKYIENDCTHSFNDNYLIEIKLYKNYTQSVTTDYVTSYKIYADVINRIHLKSY